MKSYNIVFPKYQSNPHYDKTLFQNLKDKRSDQWHENNRWFLQVSIQNDLCTFWYSFLKYRVLHDFLYSGFGPANTHLHTDNVFTLLRLFYRVRVS